MANCMEAQRHRGREAQRRQGSGGEEEEALRYRGREAQRRQGSGGEEDEALRHWAPPTHLLKDLLAAMPSSLVV